jgi:hypothetical protein
MNRVIRSLAAARPAFVVVPLAPLALATVLVSLSGCTPGIGDKCTLSTDCSVTGTLLCDSSQPNGYCTVLNCTDDSCPNSAVCVLFQPTVPGCPYDDYQSPSRTSRSFCMAHCSRDSDCRQSEGYICRDPTAPPWNAAILDNNQSQGVCLAAPGLLSVTSPRNDAAVCLATTQDAEATLGGDGAVDAPSEAGDAGPDGSLEAGLDGGRDASDASRDGGVAGGSVDGQSDAPNDAPGDTGSADATDGG